MNLITKMVSLTITLVALLSLIVGLAYFNMSQMINALSSIGNYDVPLSNEMSTVMKGQLSQSAWLERSLLAAELEITEDLDRAVEQFNVEHKKVDRAIQTALVISSDYRNADFNSEEMEAYQDQQSTLTSIRRGYDDYYETGIELLEFLQAGEIIKADTVLKKVQVQSGELVMLIDPLAQKLSMGAEDSAQTLVESSNTSLGNLNSATFNNSDSSVSDNSDCDNDNIVKKVKTS